MGVVDKRKSFDGLDFDNNRVFDDKVGLKNCLQLDATIDERNPRSDFNLQSRFAQLDREALGIYRLEKARTELLVDLDPATP